MYDYVIVGAGSAGCVLAARLTEDPDISVLLLEAGPPDANENIHVPLGYLQLPGTEVDWDYCRRARARTATAAGSPLPRGRVLGGSSSINAMVYIRGNHRDYDEWGVGRLGLGRPLPLLPQGRGQRARRVRVARGRRARCRSPTSAPGIAITPAFVEAGVEAGLARNEDFNGAEQDGVGMYQVTQRGGMRASAAVAYLHPAMERPNLTVMPYMHVNRVLFEGTRAVGVEAVAARRGAGAARRARGDPLRRRLQLAAAADALRGRPGRAPDDARSRGAARPAGGRREPQRPRLPPTASGRRPSRRACCSRSSPRRWRSSKPRRPGRSPPTSPRRAASPGSAPAPRRPTSSSTSLPLQIVDEGIGDPEAHGRLGLPLPAHPREPRLGALASNDPTAQPVIRNEFYSAGADMERMVAGAAADAGDLRAAGARALLRRAATTRPDGDSDEALRAHVARTTFPIYHPVGTCAIGSVVDTELRVEGLEGVRVVDAR